MKKKDYLKKSTLKKKSIVTCEYNSFQTFFLSTIILGSFKSGFYSQKTIKFK